MNEPDEGEPVPINIETTDTESPRDRLGQEAERAVDEIERGVIDLLAWLLDTETRSRIYIYLRKNPDSTSEEVASGTGLYPSTVREALAELHEEGTVTRRKRESDGAGNNPFEYAAIPPSDLLGDAVGGLQEQLNAVLTLDDRFDEEPRTDEDPITISVNEELLDPGDDDDRSESADDHRDAE